jgi:hypothetical protein
MPTATVVVNPNEAPAIRVEEHLAQLLETAQKLHDDADWLQAEAADLFSGLKNVTHGAVIPHIGGALDAAAWVDSAATNIVDELWVLIGCLQEVLEV